VIELLLRAFRRLRSYFLDLHLEQDLDTEMAAHLEFAIEENLKRGMPAEEARRQALIRFGGLEQAKQRHREARGGLALGTLIQDLEYAVRMWWKNPGFALAAVITIGLGIGVNASVFTLAHAVIAQNLGFDGKGRAVYVIGSAPGCELPCDTMRSYPDFLDFRARSKTFESLAAYTFESVQVSDKSGFPDRYEGMAMSANGFSALGQRPLLGRNFIAADEQPGAAPVVMLSYRFWQTRYGKDPSILGKTIRINEVPTVIVGVMPQEVQFRPFSLDMWLPIVPIGHWLKRENRSLMMFGRLVKGATLATVNAEMSGISRQLETAYPLADKNIGIRVLDAQHYFWNRIRLIFVALWIAVGFVLLVACANVANLLLARAVGRSREISIRIALGASRWRVIRQLLAESVTLSTAGGICGWLFAIWGVRVFDAVVPEKPVWLDFSMDYTVFAYLAAISVGAGIFFGLAPALRLSKVGVHAALKDGGLGTSMGSHTRHLAGVFVIAETALTVVLLVGAAVMVRLIINSYRAQIGVKSANVLTVGISLPDKKYPRPTDQISFFDQLVARLRVLPGVEATSVASSLPGRDGDRFSYQLEGAAPVADRQEPHVGGLVIGSDYFQVMEVRPLVGRMFADSDDTAGAPVVIVNHAFAAKFWPAEGNPLGKRIRLINDGVPQPWRTVVGVVPDIFQNYLVSGEFDPLIYLPYRQEPRSGLFAVARTKVPSETLSKAFRSQVQALDSDLPVDSLRTLDDDLDLNNWPVRIFGSMFTSFAVIALLMASVGLYAVVAQMVGQRTQEIGVRLAMGASRAHILRLVFGQGMRQMALGLCLGLAAASALTRLLRALLSGALHPDPAMFLVVALVLVAAGALACGVPARRAMWVDPVEALRCE
jgi:putative ABC transport system permease protein